MPTNRNAAKVTPSQLTTILPYLIRARKPIMLSGAPGVGKTDIMNQACASINTPLVLNFPVISQEVDYKGFPHIRNGMAEFAPFNDLRILTEATEPTVFMYEDIGQSRHEVQAACFPPGTPVTTTTGVAHIETLSPGDMVLTDDGAPRPVMETFSRTYRGLLHRIKAASLLPFEATSEHPILTLDRRTMAESWKVAGEIEKGDLIAIPIAQPNVNDTSTLIVRNGLISRYVDLTEEFAAFLGYFVGNGCYVQHKAVQRVEITINASHTHKADEVEALMGMLTHGRVFRRTAENVTKIAIHDPDLGAFLSATCGVGAVNKRIPSFILYHENVRLVEAFLRGYLATDGALAQYRGVIRGVQFTTISASLAAQVQQAFTRLGVLAGIKHNPGGTAKFGDKEYNCQESYRMNCYDSEACARIGVETGPKRKVVWAVKHNDRLWTQVRSCTIREYAGPVYNLEVAERHTYCANNAVVHNCMQTVLARRLNDRKISDFITFAAATNRKEDRAGVSSVIEPLKSRFITILELVPDLDDWVRWAYANGMPDELIAFIRTRPEFLYDFEPTHEMTNSPSPRTVAHVGELFNLGIPDRDLNRQLFGGAAGMGLATEFMGFLQLYGKIPNVDTLLANPHTADLPDREVGLMYALSTALVRRVSEKTYPSFFVIADRLPGEYRAKMVIDAMMLHPWLAGTDEVAAFMAANKDIMF